jgi:hypothetical protein
VNRAASLLAQALRELQSAAAADAGSTKQALADSRSALDRLVQRFEQQLAEEKEQRLVLAGQLTTLASSLDRLVSHLQGLSTLMADLLERLATPAQPQPAAEPAFTAGGEGISLTLSGVPGFQALMDIQKALGGLDQVASASVERFQEGDSRLLLQLRAPLRANDLAAGLRAATGLTIVVEESRPELQRLRLKIVPSS